MQTNDESPIRNYHLLRVLRRMVAEFKADEDLSPLLNYMNELKALFPACKCNC